jgi:hypothetical protein
MGEDQEFLTVEAQCVGFLGCAYAVLELRERKPGR